MKKICIWMFSLVMLWFLPQGMRGQTVVDTVPYHCNFENPTQNGRWTFANGSCYNYLVIDTMINTTPGGHAAMYVTQQFVDPPANAYKTGSSTAGDETYVSSRCFAYTTVYFPTAGTYDVGYWWHCMGETIYDFGRVILAPTSYVFAASTVGWDTASSIPGQYLGAVLTPNVCISLNGSHPLSGSAEMRYHSQTFTIETPGAYRLAVMWMNDGNVGENPPLMVDDISIVPHSCPFPGNLMVDQLTDTSATFIWEGNAPLYEVAWDTLGTTGGYAHVDTTPLNTYTVRGLFPRGQYEFVARALCTESSSLISTYHIHIPDTGCDPIYNFPYTFNFDSATTFGAADTPPVIPCWGIFNDANGSNYKGYPYLYNNINYAHTGSYCLYYYYTSSANYPKNFGIHLPRLGDTVDIRNVVVKFWMRSTSTSYHPRMVVGVMSDPFNPLSFVGCDTVTTNSQTPVQFIVPLSNYMGNGRYVALKAAAPTSNTAYYACVDDVVIDFESCIRPSIVESEITDTSASFTWLSTGAYYYQWSWIENDSTPNITPDTTLTFTHLQQNTSYTLYVRSVCATPGQWNAIHFTTECGPLRDMPWEEGFEECSTGTGTSHPCWHFLSDGSGTYNNYYPYITSGTTYAYGGSGQYIYMYLPPATTTTSGMPTWECVVLPRVDTNEALLNQMRLSFWVATSSSTYYDYLYIGTMSDPNDISTFVVFDSTYVGATTPRLKEFDLTNITPHREYLALYGHRHATDYRSFYIDQVSLQLIPDCPKVYNDYVTDITTSSATAHWSDSLATAWDLYCCQHGDGFRDSVAIHTTDTFYTFTNLLPNTKYDIWILPSCPDNGVAEPLRHIFRTHCETVNVLPIVQDWEEVGVSSNTVAPEIPCWTYNTNTHNYYMPYVSSSSGASYQHLGTKSLYWYHPATTGVNYPDSFLLVSPSINTDNYNIQNVIVKMWTKPTSVTYTPTFQIGVMTNPDDASTFVPCQTISTDGTANWQELIGGLTSYTGTGTYVAIHDAHPITGNAAWYAYVDEITIDYTNCPPPAIVSTSVTTNSVSFTWHGTSPSYLVEISAGPLSGIETLVNDTSYTFTGLTPNTPYTVYVKGLCGADTSEIISAALRTECVALDTLPFSYGFEGDPTGSAAPFPYCWRRVVTPGAVTNYFPYVSSGSTARVGNQYLYWYGTTSTSYPDYNICVLPQLGSNYNIANTSLLFWARPTSASYHPVFIVGVMDDPDSIESFVGIDTVYVENVLEWQPFEVPFSSYTGTGTYAAIRINRPTSAWYSYMDDIELFVTPNCSRPQHVQDSNVLVDGFDIYWNATSDASSYQVHVYSEGVLDTLISTTNTHLTVTGLTGNTPYTVNVRGICGTSDTSMWSFDHNVRTACVPISTFPYFCSFEDDPTGSSNNDVFAYCWHRLNNGTTYYGYPYISASTSYAHSGSKGLYWYNATTTGTYGDYQCIILPEVDTTVAPTPSLTLSFWAKPSSTSYHPVFQVGVLSDPDDISTFVGIDTIALANSTTWAEYTVTFENYTGTGNYVGIKADRPTSVWYAYVDDITLNHITHCAPPTNITVNTTLDEARLHWTATTTNIEFSYREAESTEGYTTLLPTADSVVLTGLTPNTRYEYRIFAICDTNDTSSVIESFFRTEICENVELDTVGFYAWSNDYSYLPFYEYNKHTYSQQIIDSASMQNIVMLDAIEFLTNYAVYNAENCTIYIGHTNRSQFASGSSWVPVDSLTAFYSGSMNMSEGWNRFVFDSAFVWDGHSNVVVAVLRSGNEDYYANYVGKRVNLMDDHTALYTTSSSPISLTSSLPAGTLVQYRNMMRLVTCGDRTCHTPVISQINTTYTTAELIWEGGMGSYEFAVKPADELIWPDPIVVNTNSYNVTGLMPATAYHYSIRQVCDSVTYSEWLAGTFVTDTMPCDVPANLHYLSIGGHDITIDWETVTDTNSWQIHLFNTAHDTVFEVTTHPVTIGNLFANTTYNITVSTLCGHGIVISDPSETLTFTTDLCRPVQGVAVSDVTENSAIVHWTPGDNNTGTWVVSYGLMGFDNGTGTTDTVTTDTYTIVGLEPETDYDVYVLALCAEDWPSYWSDVVSFTTTPHIGIDNIDHAHNCVIHPNPTTGNTTVTIAGVQGTVDITLIDMQGRTLSTSSTECNGECRQTIDVSDLAQGTYFVHIRTNGDSWITKLVVK